MKRWKVERRKDGKWEMYGVFNENFITQLAAAVGHLVKKGYEVYKTIRVVEVKKNG